MMVEVPMFKKSKEFIRPACGCNIVMGDTVAQIAYCPQHAAAEATQKAIKEAMAELGVPNKNYPAPVSNAYGILKAALI